MSFVFEKKFNTKKGRKRVDSASSDDDQGPVSDVKELAAKP